MDRFTSFSFSPPMPLFSDGMEVDPELAPLFMHCNQHASSPAGARTTLQSSFPNLLSPLTGSSQAVRNSSPRSAHALPRFASCSVWSNIPAGNINNVGRSPPFPIPVPSESSVHGNQQAPRYDVVVAGAHSTLPHEQEQEPTRISPCTMTSILHSQTRPANLYPEHVVSWYLTCWEAVVINGPRKFIPQSIYQPRSLGDQERYVSLARLHPRIIFRTQDSPEWGIPVQRLLSRRVTRLVDGNEPAFASCGPSIGIRMQWPGYQPCHKQVSTRDYTPKRRMINKAKLAKVVARCVEQFMDTMNEQAMEVESNRRWKVGPSDITPNDIILVSLHHVSQGSWQPQLRLRRTIGNNVTAGSHNSHRF